MYHQQRGCAIPLMRGGKQSAVAIVSQCAAKDIANRRARGSNVTPWSYVADNNAGNGNVTAAQFVSNFTRQFAGINTPLMCNAAGEVFTIGPDGQIYTGNLTSDGSPISGDMLDSLDRQIASGDWSRWAPLTPMYDETAANNASPSTDGNSSDDSSDDSKTTGTTITVVKPLEAIRVDGSQPITLEIVKDGEKQEPYAGLLTDGQSFWNCSGSVYKVEKGSTVPSTCSFLIGNGVTETDVTKSQ
jgi:hypothetical protein